MSEQWTVKFRAYDLEHHHMYANAYPFEHLVYVEMDPNDPEVKPFESKMHKVNGKWFYFILAKDIALMEYTGRQDSNGRNICEGDIIKHSPHWEDFREISVVRSIHEFCGDSGCYGSIEVIGNIHEHPHLLNDTQGE